MKSARRLPCGDSLRTRRSLLGVIVSLSIALAAREARSQAPDPRALAEVATGLERSVVEVEWHLQEDRGENPEGWLGTGCPVCDEGGGEYASEVLADDLPLRGPGYVIADGLVVTQDPNIEPRYLRSIVVSRGDSKVEAKIHQYARHRDAVLLRLDGSVGDAVPLAFAEDVPAPFVSFHAFADGADLRFVVHPLGSNVRHDRLVGPHVPAPALSIIAGWDGRVVGLATDDGLPIDGSWKGSPAKWDVIDTSEAALLREKTRDVLQKSVMTVTLELRSPKGSARSSRYGRYSYLFDESVSETEIRALGVIMDGRHVLVLAHLEPDATARLERVLVAPNGEDGLDRAREASFVLSLKELGALVVELDEAIEGTEPVRFAGSGFRSARGRYLPIARVRVFGEARAEFFGHLRFQELTRGRRGHAFPSIPETEWDLWVLNEELALVGFPAVLRARVPSMSGRSWYDDDSPRLVPAVFATELLADTERYADRANVPRSAEEEGRSAWLGVVVQSLDADLARANGVAHETADGSTGALVTAVYPGSPAAEAGLEPGAILLRIRPAGEARYVEVEVESDDANVFDWAELDELADEWLEHVPPPWPSAIGSLESFLTRLGDGTRYELVFVQGGETRSRELVVTDGPAHFGSAPEHKAAELGLTVKDLTYEVRAYLLREADDPGVVISKLEPGGPASIGGIKPFELVTHVGNEPVRSVEEFRAAIEGAEEVRLTIQRMARSRVVRLRPAAPQESLPPDE